MILKKIDRELSVCKVEAADGVRLLGELLPGAGVGQGAEPGKAAALKDDEPGKAAALKDAEPGKAAALKGTGPVFAGVTDEEFSLVCPTDRAPQSFIARDDGWRAFRIEGVLDFSLIGILSKISGILAKAKIGIFAVSTYNTDYVLVKSENYERALAELASRGYEIEE